LAGSVSGTVTTVHNARVQLLATLLNNAAPAFIVAAVIAPATTGQLQGGWRAAATIAWGVLGAGLHFAARVVLGRLR